MANEKYTVYMGTEKFRPAEGYFARELIWYVDEENAIPIPGTNYTAYISAWEWDSPTASEVNDMMPFIYATTDMGGDSEYALFAKLKSSSGGVEGCAFLHWSDDPWYLVPQGQAAAVAYWEYGPGHQEYDYSNIDHIVLYRVLDYNMLSYNSEQDLDEYQQRVLTLYAKPKGDRYIWSLTP